MSPALRDQILSDAAFRRKVAQWIRSVFTLNP
jgi:hypothetical protein